MANNPSTPVAGNIVLVCPAKVNLALSVGPPDGRGYHPLASWMVAVRFGDRLALSRRARGSSYDIGFAVDAPRAEPVDWPLERDLAVRAHVALQRRLGRELPIDVELRKAIPTGAGLGGGSSNAAGMLVGLDRLYDLHLADGQLLQIAGELGSDVAFMVMAMRGQASALVGGFGERVTAQALRRPIHLVLVLPPFRCATGAVYSRFDETAGVPRVEAGVVAGLAAADPVDPHALFNDLGEPAMFVAPELRSVHDRVQAVTGRPTHVTGSGAALFMVAESELDAATTARQVEEATRLPCVATRTLP